MLVLFSADVFAQAAPAADPILSFLPLVILFIVFYFLLIRPQSKRVKEHKSMLDSLKKGDEVVTNGGVLGKVTGIGENFVQLEIANNITVKVQRPSISSLMPKGTMNGDL
jgi:preprotein translocase subunit YajC